MIFSLFCVILIFKSKTIKKINRTVQGIKMKEYRFDPEIEIDFKSLIPLRVQLFEKIRKAVIARRVAPGTRVISESQVAKTFSINRGTVHLAYMDLIQCGLFETKSAKSS